MQDWRRSRTPARQRQTNFSIGNMPAKFALVVFSNVRNSLTNQSTFVCCASGARAQLSLLGSARHRVKSNVISFGKFAHDALRAVRRCEPLCAPAERSRARRRVVAAKIDYARQTFVRVRSYTSPVPATPRHRRHRRRCRGAARCKSHYKFRWCHHVHAHRTRTEPPRRALQKTAPCHRVTDQDAHCAYSAFAQRTADACAHTKL